MNVDPLADARYWNHAMSNTRIVRHKIWTRLAAVAKPDARFHFDFEAFIPDFEGSAVATDRLFALPFMEKAELVFVAPDNSLVEARRRLIAAGVPIIVSTFNIQRGFRLIAPGSVPKGQEGFAAWTDGLEHFGVPVTLAEITQLGRFTAMITGASAISPEGVRFGKGHVYFDMEWGLFSEIGLVSETTPIATVVHDVQVVDQRIYSSPDDVLIDAILTPTRHIDTHRRSPRPRGLRWKLLEPEVIDTIPPLKELQRLRGVSA